MTNLVQYREIRLPKVTRDCLIPKGATLLNQGWYGPTWCVEFLLDGLRCRVAVTLEVMDDSQYTAEDVDVGS
jgi:hypothetical protein